MKVSDKKNNNIKEGQRVGIARLLQIFRSWARRRERCNITLGKMCLQIRIKKVMDWRHVVNDGGCLREQIGCIALARRQTGKTSMRL